MNKISVGDKVRFHLRLTGGKKIDFEGIVDGQKTSFGQKEYIITEMSPLNEIVVRNAKKV